MSEFFRESPARQLRRELGIPEPTRSRLRVGDNLPFRLGDVVHRIDDERHLGEVIAIESLVFVTVRWHDTNWKEIVQADELTKAKRGD